MAHLSERRQEPEDLHPVHKTQLSDAPGGITGSQLNQSALRARVFFMARFPCRARSYKTGIYENGYILLLRTQICCTPNKEVV